MTSRPDEQGFTPNKGMRDLDGRRWVLRLVAVLFIALAVAGVWISNVFLTERFTETTRNRTDVRLALYSGSIMAEIERNEMVPFFLAEDPVLVRALDQGDFATTSGHLIALNEVIRATSLTLLNREGRVVAATDRNRLGEPRNSEQYFIQAQRQQGATVFTVNERDTNSFVFAFSREIRESNRFLGVILVEVDLQRFFDRWRGSSEALFITDTEGNILLATEPRWRGRSEEDALAVSDPPSAIQRALDATGSWGLVGDQAYAQGDPTLRHETRIPFRGWRLVSFTTYSSVRQQVNGVLALQIMGFALALAGGFYWLSRRARRQTRAYQRESAELRRLNDRLQREIAERQKAEQSLSEAELSLAQSQKLAALGEMSAAVSHELNQPLAAMKTYLAGAKLLMQRRRPDEALSSFQRIDDLLERMGAITRQLKSYARKGDQAFAPTDLREALGAALAMMEPQLRQMVVEINQTLPRKPVYVMVDRLRLEQVVINLLRNALDAMRDIEPRQLDLIIAEGDQAVLTVRDNGHGIDDLEALFEPFYTTKAPGKGVGLGLAISSGIMADFGGRLTARNSQNGGAVFEIRLPLYTSGSEAAE